MWSFFLLTCCCQLCFSLVRCTLYQSKQLLGTFSCSRGPKVKFTFVKCSSNCTEFPLLILVKFHLATCIHLGKLDLGPGCPSLLLRDSLCQQEDIHHAQAFCHQRFTHEPLVSIRLGSAMSSLSSLCWERYQCQQIHWYLGKGAGV